MTIGIQKNRGTAVSIEQMIDQSASEMRRESIRRFGVLTPEQSKRLERNKHRHIARLRKAAQDAATKAQPWHVRLGAVVLGVLTGPAGCSDGKRGNNGGDGNINNNNDLDATTDANDSTVNDADVDGGVLPYVCIEEGRDGIIDDKKELVTDTHPCNVADLVYFQSKFYMVCKWSSNRLLSYDPNENSLAGLGSVTQSTQGPYNTVGDVHPRAITVFEPQAGYRTIGVTYQMVNQPNPTDVKGGLYLHDVGSGSKMDRFDLSFIIFHGGNPDGEQIVLQDPRGIIFSQGKLWVAPENFNREVDDYALSVLVGAPVIIDGSLVRVSRAEQPQLGIANVGSYRLMGVGRLSDSIIAGAYGGIAAANPQDAEPARIAFFDTTSEGTFITAVRTFDLGLGDKWQLTALPRIGVSADKKSYVVAAENPSEAKKQIVTMRLNDINNIPGTSYLTHTFDITPYARGRVQSIIVDDMRVYVTEEGDPNAVEDVDKFGNLIVLDINPADGSLSFKAAIPLGLLPRPAELEPVTGKLYQPVMQANCKESGSSPYIMEIDTNRVPVLQ